MAEIDNKIIVGVIGLFAGIYGCLIKHLSSSKKHPCSDNLVYKDVCNEKVKRLEDCIEGQTKITEMQYKTLGKRIDEGFGNLEKLIKNERRS